MPRSRGCEAVPTVPERRPAVPGLMLRRGAVVSVRFGLASRDKRAVAQVIVDVVLRIARVERTPPGLPKVENIVARHSILHGVDVALAVGALAGSQWIGTRGAHFHRRH